MKIRVYPDPILKKVSMTITKFDSSLHAYAGQLLDTMYRSGGVGLAAVQVGLPVRLIAVDTSFETDIIYVNNADSLILVNPEIVESSGPFENTEGCLSFPNVYAKVTRFSRIKVKYQDVSGKDQLLDLSVNENSDRKDILKVICIQHEIDHLNGIVFVDHLSPLRKESAIRKHIKLQKKLKRIAKSK